MRLKGNPRTVARRRSLTVGRNDVQMDGANLFADALKFVVRVDANDEKTACAVQIDHKVELAKDGAV